MENEYWKEAKAYMIITRYRIIQDFRKLLQKIEYSTETFTLLRYLKNISAKRWVEGETLEGVIEIEKKDIDNLKEKLRKYHRKKNKFKLFDMVVKEIFNNCSDRQLTGV
jgi:hypothetical protein